MLNSTVIEKLFQTRRRKDYFTCDESIFEVSNAADG